MGWTWFFSFSPIIRGCLVAVGLLGVLWCIRHAAWLRKTELPDEQARIVLNRLIFAHTAAIGTAFFGLALVVVGIVLN